MGRIETDHKRRARRNEVQAIILDAVKATGFLTLAVLLPNVAGAMVKLGLAPSPRQKEVVQRATKRLIEKGMLEWRDSRLRLTSSGEQQLRMLALRQQVRKKMRWDKKWRVLVFDIPEKRARVRQRVRGMLKSVGFVRLQDSVWVYPHDCEDLIMLLKADFHIGNEMLYMIVDTIERDGDLRRHFKLT